MRHPRAVLDGRREVGRREGGRKMSEKIHRSQFRREVRGGLT